MNGSKVTTVIVTALLALRLCGCGRDENGGDPGKLAREITDAIKDSASVHREHPEAVDSTLSATQRTVAIGFPDHETCESIADKLRALLDLGGLSRREYPSRCGWSTAH